MSVALLDVNVLIALMDPDHVDHERAHVWAESSLKAGWATCAITENGFVRILSQPRYPNAVTPDTAAGLLQAAKNSGHHSWWSCSISVTDRDKVDIARLHGPRQVTDAYLLALAVANNGRLVTFDRVIPLAAVAGAGDEHVTVL